MGYDINYNDKFLVINKSNNIKKGTYKKFFRNVILFDHLRRV